MGRATTSLCCLFIRIDKSVAEKSECIPVKQGKVNCVALPLFNSVLFIPENYVITLLNWNRTAYALVTDDPQISDTYHREGSFPRRDECPFRSAVAPDFTRGVHSGTQAHGLSVYHC